MLVDNTPQKCLQDLGMEAMAPIGEQDLFNMNNLVPMNGLSLLHMNGQLPIIKQDVKPMVNGTGCGGPATGGGSQLNLSQPPQAPPPSSTAQTNGTATESSPAGPSQGGNSSGRSTPNSSDPSAAKLFVGGLSWQTSSDKLRQYFGMFGTVTDVLIMKDPITQRSRGFGFITFAEADTVEKVLKVPIHTLDGKKIDPKHATPKNRPKATNKTKKIFVGGVSQDTSSDEVKAYFSQFGKVEETVMLMDQQTKRHRGFGFVTFENEDVVDRICEIHFHTIKNKKVECKKAQPKEAVAAAGLLLGKRVMMGPLGMRMAAPAPVAAGQLVSVTAQAAQAAAAVAAQQAVAGYSKLFGGYPGLASYRYAPYPVAAPAPATPTPAAPAPALTPASPYQGYSLPNVDMTSFQGVDWGSMYGMGMYV
ncbi:RNA-binding protein Musashi homolog 2-like isoform X2 [Cimex lectularius]|uniref:RRM domain-containing protein n=1 Tax=Cimex lectularius TaxID=79782 RepID=A0A8I6S141_CIMLE|nr:RNA-binding protein Musashi homolog 2-like isoform X2 [Cimex lectularius]